MAIFSKEHLKLIMEIRTLLDNSEEFKKDYETNVKFHSFIEWFCNTPELPNPKLVLTCGLEIVWNTNEYNFVDNERINWADEINTLIDKVQKDVNKLLADDDHYLSKETQLKLNVFQDKLAKL